jgi:hypothetical protein
VKNEDYDVIERLVRRQFQYGAKMGIIEEKEINDRVIDKYIQDEEENNENQSRIQYEEEN